MNRLPSHRGVSSLNPDVLRANGLPRPCAIVLMLLSLWTVGCGQQPDPPVVEDMASRPVIAVTSYPLSAMSRHLAGELADIRLVIDGEQTSPDWRPTSPAVRTMQQARRLLISGGDHEPWLQRVTVPRSRVIDTARGYYDQFIRIPDAVIHQHGPDGGHSHPGVVWATWLDPRLAASQLEQTRAALTEVLPNSTAKIQAAADTWTRQLTQLDQQLEQLAAQTADTPLTVLGDAPVYQYLTRRLGWKLRYLHWSADDSIDESERESLNEALSQSPAALFLMRSTVQSTAQLTVDLGPTPLLTIDLCDQHDSSATLFERMQRNLDNLQQAIGRLPNGAGG